MSADDNAKSYFVYIIWITDNRYKIKQEYVGLYNIYK